VLADGLRIDMQLAGDASTRMACGVERRRLVGEICSPDMASARYLASFQEGEGRRPVDPKCLRQLHLCCTGEVPGDQLLDLRRGKAALVLFVLWRGRPTPARDCFVLAGKAFDSLPKAKIEQSGTKTRDEGPDCPYSNP